MNSSAYYARVFKDSPSLHKETGEIIVLLGNNHDIDEMWLRPMV